MFFIHNAKKKLSQFSFHVISHYLLHLKATESLSKTFSFALQRLQHMRIMPGQSISNTVIQDGTVTCGLDCSGGRVGGLGSSWL